MEESDDKHAEKAGRTSSSSGVFMHLSPMDVSHLPALCMCLRHTKPISDMALLLLLLQASVKAPGSPGLLRQPPPPTHTLLCPSLTWIMHDQTVCVELISQLLRGPHRHWWLHKATSPRWRPARHQMSTVQSDELWVTILHLLPLCREGDRALFSAARLQTHATRSTAALVEGGPHCSLHLSVQMMLRAWTRWWWQI